MITKYDVFNYMKASVCTVSAIDIQKHFSASKGRVSTLLKEIDSEIKLGRLKVDGFDSIGRKRTILRYYLLDQSVELRVTSTWGPDALELMTIKNTVLDKHGAAKILKCDPESAYNLLMRLSRAGHFTRSKRSHPISTTEFWCGEPKQHWTKIIKEEHERIRKIVDAAFLMCVSE